ncbi:hypothetical protein KL938_002967 [Ogataea parapolymorpha]|nr:hypothetical protein KL938_002967 [Ogataea parapolymorpha]
MLTHSLLSREYHSLAPEEIISHKTTGMKSRLKFSDDSHREKVWSPEMVFYYMNLLFDEYKTGTRFVLFKSRDSYGPKTRHPELTFHPFLWAGDWHLAVGFHESQKIVLVNCSESQSESDVGFPLRSVLKIEDFVIYFGHKVNKSTLKKPYRVTNFIEPLCPINAINLLSLVFTFCVSPTHLKEMFISPNPELRTFDVSEFYEEIKNFDRFGNARQILGNSLMNRLVEKSKTKPELDPVIIAKFDPETADFSKFFPVKTAKHFLDSINAQADQLPEDADVFDEVVEMIEGWCHVENHTGFDNWSMLFREITVGCYNSRSKIEFDEEEFQEVLLSADHRSQVFPLVLENGSSYLINADRTEDQLVVNVLEISFKSRGAKDVCRPFAVRRLIEMYGWHNRRLVNKINMDKYSVQGSKLYHVLSGFIYFIHYFIYHGKFDVHFKPDQMDIDSHSIVFQSMMHKIVAKDKPGVIEDYARLIRYIEV